MNHRLLHCLILTLLSLLVVCGCGTQTGHNVVIVPETVNAKTLLLSEMFSVESPTELIECPIRIENTSSQNKSVKLLSTGCSCYGVTLNGRKLSLGESIEIAGNSEVTLNIEAQAPVYESVHDYRGRFEIPQNKSQVEQEVICELHVYQDLKVSPKVLVCDANPGIAATLKKTINLERIYRSPDGNTPNPRFGELPPGMEVQQISKLGQPVELEQGLWKTQWDILVNVQVQGDESSIGPTEAFTVHFENPDGADWVATSQLVRRVQLPIHYPQRLHFGQIPAGESRQRILFISSRDRSTFHLKLNPEALPKNLKVSIPSGFSNRYQVEIQIQGDESGEWKGILPLKTDLNEQPEIQIELTARFLSEPTD